MVMMKRNMNKMRSNGDRKTTVVDGLQHQYRSQRVGFIAEECVKMRANPGYGRQLAVFSLENSIVVPAFLNAATQSSRSFTLSSRNTKFRYTREYRKTQRVRSESSRPSENIIAYQQMNTTFQ